MARLYCCIIAIFIISVFGHSNNGHGNKGKKGKNKKSFTTTSSSHWGYSDQDAWYISYPDCAAADESPINVDPDETIIDASECVAEFDWDIDYDHNIFKVVNNGHSLQLVEFAFIPT